MKLDGRQIFDIVLIAITVAVSTIYIIIPWFKADKYFVDLEYHYKVTGIEYRQGYRGFPHIQVDSMWRLPFSDEDELLPFLQVGDSIVKKSGSRKITLYKFDTDGKLEKMEFE